MSNQNENGQELAYSQPENGKNVKNDKQREKKKPLTAFVQMAFDGPANSREVELSQNCSSVAEHATFLEAKINESQGSIIGLQLNGPVERAAILKGNVALMDDKVPLEVDLKYTFEFKLAKVQEEKVDGLDLFEEVAQMEKEELKKQVEEQAGNVARLADEQAMNMTQLVVGLTNCQDQLDQLAEQQLKTKDLNSFYMDLLKRRVEELEKKCEEHQKLLEEKEAKAKLEEEQRMANLEYARLIGVPIVAHLRAHYNREKLTHLLEHGNVTTPSICIQNNQYLNDPGLLQNIVDKLATAEKPAQMIGEVTIEWDGRNYFTWPKREELKLKDKNQVTLTFNEVTGNPETHLGKCWAKYELINGGCCFQVFIHYFDEYNYFNKMVAKFTYSRLP